MSGDNDDDFEFILTYPVYVIHDESGMRRESTHRDLLDEVLEELASKSFHPKHLGEANR